MEKLAENVWVERYLSKVLCADIGRNVTCFRLRSGEVVVHSTAPFSGADAARINAVGTVTTVVEASGFHDTYTALGESRFSSARLMVPAPLCGNGGRRELLSEEGLAGASGGELLALKLGGMPAADEHAVYHPASRTLVVADLVFNLGDLATGWTGFLMKTVSNVGRKPAVSRLFRAMTKDRGALAASVEQMLEWDFERVVVGHGDVIETRGAFEDALGPLLTRG